MSRPNVAELVRQLNVGISHAAVYCSGHGRVRLAARQFAEGLAHLLERTDEDGFFLGVVEKRLVSDGRPLLGATLLSHRLIDAAERLHVGGFLFHEGLGEEEIARFLQLLSEKTATANADEATRLFASRGMTNISPSPLYGEAGWLGDHWSPVEGGRVRDEEMTTGAAGAATATAVDCYHSMRAAVEEAHGAAHRDADLDVAAALTAAEGLVKNLSERPWAMLYLSRYPDFDTYTVGHSVRVALISAIVGHSIGLPARLLVDLATAALLHDIGKSRIPDQVLFKQGPLDEDETRVMSEHPILGAEVLLRSPMAGPLSVGAAFGHHLRKGPRGYPAVEDWVRTSWLTKLIQVCDVFEALTAVRPYKAPMTPRKAYEVMLLEAHEFEPRALATTVRALGIYPPGTRVLLDSGRRAFVLRANETLDRPVVRLLPDGFLGIPGEADGDLVDLAGRPDLSVVEVLPEVEDEADVPSPDPTPVTVHTYDCGHEVQASAA